MLTLPSHVQNVPVSSIVFSGMTASIFSTLSCGVRIPSTGHAMSMSAMSLWVGKRVRCRVHANCVGYSRVLGTRWIGLTSIPPLDAWPGQSFGFLFASAQQPCAAAFGSGPLSRLRMRRICQEQSAIRQCRIPVLRMSDLTVFYLPILKVAKVRRRARVTGDKDYGLDWYLRRKQLLSCDDRTDGVGTKVELKVFERATPFRVRIGSLWQSSFLGRTSRLLASKSAC